MRRLFAACLIAVALPALASKPQEEDAAAYARGLWSALAEARLVGAGSVNTVPSRGVEPHGAMLETFYSSLTIAGHTGPVVVQRAYGPAGVTAEAVMRDRAGHLGAVTVMFRRQQGYDAAHGDWFWAQYRPDGALDKGPDGAPLAGTVAGCIDCHAGAPGGDMLYTTDLK